jgi:hypothetical protein
MAVCRIAVRMVAVKQADSRRHGRADTEDSGGHKARSGQVGLMQLDWPGSSPVQVW